MAKPGTPLPPWAQAGLYPASLYPINLPWGDPNPVGGLATPWSGQPRLNVAGLIAFANAGLTPQIPTDGSSFNAWLSLSQNYSAWVEDGTSDPDATAHIMETEASGLSKALAYEATSSFQGALGSKAPLANGATIPDGMQLELVNAATISGGAGSDVSTTTTTNTERRWVDSGTTLPNDVGRTRWNDTFFSLHDSFGNVHTFDDPSRGYDATFTGLNSIDDTTATCSRNIKHNEPVWVNIGCRFQNTTASTNMNYRIEVTGPLGTLDALVDTAFVSSSNHGRFLNETIEFTPTDLWPGEVAIQTYTFKLRLGRTAGTLTAKRNIISVVSAFRV